MNSAGKAFRGFSMEALDFLRRLKRNNRRPWFQKNKPIYDEKVRQPMVELVQALNLELMRIAPEMVTEPRRAIYRIYRDVRFSPDKSPYKTHIAALFTPRNLPKHAGGGFYVHLSPVELLVAGGVYMPGPKELWEIRNHIAQNAAILRRIVAERRFKEYFGTLEGDQLTRVPKGFPSTHPAADFLRHKQFLVSVTHPPEQALDPGLLEFLTRYFRAMTPLIRFLNKPLIGALKRDPLEF
jgi:uncharacterized protein (TIGR02453 family)